ncbi:hypothetical protein ACFPRA_01275 [Sporosarcina soli]|uniref:Uncharacterized protein n=1 Tax=Sporosarcina soli TaxID=334736 RepID=A0ABW0TED6_9BACL
MVDFLTLLSLVSNEKVLGAGLFVFVLALIFGRDFNAAAKGALKVTLALVIASSLIGSL